MRIFGLIYQTGAFDGTRDEIRFELSRSESLADAILQGPGECFVVPFDITDMMDRFYTMFNMEDWDNKWPFSGALSIGDEYYESESELIWIRRGDTWQAYDPQEYEQYGPSTLPPKKVCR